MEIKEFQHHGVTTEGKVLGGGAVHVKAHAQISTPLGGCDFEGCHCSDGHWFAYNEPRDKLAQKVKGFSLHFESRKELVTFINATKKVKCQKK